MRTGKPKGKMTPFRESPSCHNQTSYPQETRTSRQGGMAFFRHRTKWLDTLTVAILGVVEFGCVLDFGPVQNGHCGDGIVEGTERCDDGNIQDNDGCSSTCLVEPGWTCATTWEPTICQPLCGDGRLVGSEECDGIAFREHSCSDLDLGEGTLGCRSCHYDLAHCSHKPLCGNGIVEYGEDCDTDDFGNQTCATMGFDSGHLACSMSCQFDLSQCTRCGDGLCDPSEKWSCTSDCGGTTLSAAHKSTCALDEAGVLFCWGYNWGCHLGIGVCTGPVLRPHEVLSDPTMQSVSVGPKDTCTVDDDGKAWCWGANEHSQLGNGQPHGNSVARPAPVSELGNVRVVAVGYQHTCALKQDGTVWCWGDNGEGQLGTGTSVPDSADPLECMSISSVVSLACESNYCCAARSDGTVWCWGDNAQGQLGDGTTNSRDTPVQVSGLHGVTNIDAGGSHACAVESNGTVWCWGANGSGRLGDGTTQSSPHPVQVKGLPASVAVSCGYSHTCALDENGRLWCWGNNLRGQLGTEGIRQSFSPIQISSLTHVVSMSAGTDHTCAWTIDKQLWCWGANDAGQLGTGDNQDRPLPVSISLQE